MRTPLVLSICLILLCACSSPPWAPQAAVPTPTVEFSCSTPGTFDRMSLEETSRGYAYEYGMYLPPCYNEQPERLYPVLYLAPGRGSHPWTWFNAGAGQVADEMILAGEVPPFIIVTTENINADMYAESILNDLIPYVEANYRVSPERRHHAAAGGSLGGIAAYRIVLRFPGQFASLAMFGSGSVAGEEDAIREWLAAMQDDEKPRAFFNCGEGDPFMLEQARVMMGLLDEAGIEHTEIVSEGDHSYEYWVQNLPEYFRWMAEDW